MATYCLDITSFRGWSIGATHYYGKISMVGLGRRHFRPCELTYAMNGADAAKLNEKESEPIYEAGMITNRFDTKDLVRAAALAWFDANANLNADILTEWHSVHAWDAAECSILHCPPEDTARLARSSDRDVDDFLRSGIWPGEVAKQGSTG